MWTYLVIVGVLLHGVHGLTTDDMSLVQLLNATEQLSEVKSSIYSYDTYVGFHFFKISL